MRTAWKAMVLVLMVASVACAQRSRAARSEERYIQVGDRQRSYLVDLPPGYDPRRTTPVASYPSCTGGTTVQLYTVLGGGHSWPGSERLRRAQDAPSDAMDASRVIWEFFAAHPKGTS
jgi:poly(3-hydroxybutyrate) depolymerase